MVNEGGEKEKMELFVNFCEDTIFEMQLAAQMSDAGERSAMKEESEQERPDEESAEMGFFSLTTVRMALLAFHYNTMLLIKVRVLSVINVCVHLTVFQVLALIFLKKIILFDPFLKLRLNKNVYVISAGKRSHSEEFFNTELMILLIHST